MGLLLLSLTGVLVALVGLAMLAAPGWTRLVLRLFGVRWEPHPASRVAAWGLVVIGVAIAALTRAVR